jgi:hypothetical protein
VTVFDGQAHNTEQLGQLSGEETCEFQGSGNTVSIEFVTDSSGGGAGFEFDFVCNDNDGH